jgi:hypothetical protein
MRKKFWYKENVWQPRISQIMAVAESIIVGPEFFSRVAERTIEKRGVYGCLLNVATLKRDKQVIF